jgi:hypothetical protein
MMRDPKRHAMDLLMCAPMLVIDRVPRRNRVPATGRRLHADDDDERRAPTIPSVFPRR